MKQLAIAGMAAMMLFSCGQKKTEAALAAQKAEMEAQQLRDSIAMVNKLEEEERVREEAREEAKQTVHNNYYSGGSASRGTASSGTSSSSTSTSTEKKGWSNKAKGAVIGAGVGAITGAAVSKDKKGKGALIGAGVGAAAGLGTGAVLDNKKKKEEGGN
jgi:membrane protein involved in colicin uptake